MVFGLILLLCFLQPYAEAGKVYDMTDALEADSEWKNRFDSGTFIPTTFNNRIYGLPTGRQTAPIYYNKQLFKDYEVDVPKTWEEFMGTVKTFKDAGITPIDMPTQDLWVVARFFLDITGGVGGLELFQGIQTGEAAWDAPPYDPANTKTHLSQVSKVFGISETCKNKEAAMAFLKMFSENDIQEKMVTEMGLLPATKLKVDASKTDSVMAAIIELSDGIEPLTPFDVLFGSNIGAAVV